MAEKPQDILQGLVGVARGPRITEEGDVLLVQTRFGEHLQGFLREGRQVWQRVPEALAGPEVNPVVIIRDQESIQPLQRGHRGFVPARELPHRGLDRLQVVRGFLLHSSGHFVRPHGLPLPYLLHGGLIRRLLHLLPLLFVGGVAVGGG